MKLDWISGPSIAGLMALSMAACDAGPKAAVAQTAAASPVAAKEIGGKPYWAANRDRSGEENAQRQFDRNGADFATPSVQAYVQRAHAFVEAPPRGTERIERPNGDVLLYDAKANVFAVVARDGAPRTMFKPRDGAAYWQEQKTSADRAQATGAEQG